MIDHIQKWERFSQDINTDNIIEAQAGQEALRTSVFSKLIIVLQIIRNLIRGKLLVY